jgi:hypothetical protein
MTVLKVGGQTHKVFKNKEGDIIVDHTAGRPAGKWDKINLTKKANQRQLRMALRLLGVGTGKILIK